MNLAAVESTIKKIAIIDDDPDCIEVGSLLIEQAGFEPTPLNPGDFKSAEDLSNKILSFAHGALCDHRLNHRSKANYYGAQVVANLYDNKLPAVLITQFADQDYDVTIRQFRRRIPSLISRDTADFESFKMNLLLCKKEFTEGFSAHRKPHQTLVRVEGVDDEHKQTVLDVIIPSWNPKKAVRFPKAIIPSTLHSEIRIGARFFAYVNIGADQANELFFENFRLAPDPGPMNVGA